MSKTRKDIKTKKRSSINQVTKVLPKIKNITWKSLWAIVGYIGGALTILIVVFQIGQYFGYREAKKDEFKSFIEYLSEIKDGVHIADVICKNPVLKQGETCEIKTVINNTTAFECSLWIGLSATSENGSLFWNVNEDKQIIVSPSGLTVIKRQYTFQINAPLGSYDIQISLWHGTKSDPKQSELISTAVIRQQVYVDKK